MTNFERVLWGFVGGVVLIGLLNSYQIGNLRNQNAELRAQIDDPHHCVSVCVEQFEKFGC